MRHRPDAPPGFDETTTTFDAEPAGGERRFWWRVGALLLLAALVYLVFRIVVPVWQPLAWSVLLGALLAPWNARLARRLRGRLGLASGITTTLTVLLFLGPLAAITGAVAAQAAQLLRHLEAYGPQLREMSHTNLRELPFLQDPLDWLAENASVSFEQLQGWVVEATRRILETLVSSGGSIVLGAAGTLVSFLLMLFVLFFVLRDGPTFAAQLVRLLPVEAERRSRLRQHLLDVTRAVFMGIGLTALAQGTLIGVGFWLAGLPSPLVFGTIAALFALIPFVGTSIVWVPATVILALQGQYGTALFIGLWGAVLVSMVDNFLRPYLIAGRSDVPTLAVFVGVMGGLQAFGFIGLFVGPIVLGLLVALFRVEVEERDGGSPPPATPG